MTLKHILCASKMLVAPDVGNYQVQNVIGVYFQATILKLVTFTCTFNNNITNHKQ